MSSLAEMNSICDLFEAGRTDEVEAACRAILERDPADAEALNLLGLVCQKNQRLDEAIAYTAAAARNAPHDPRFHNNLGNALQDAGRHQEAVLCYQEALRLDPDLAPALGNLANALAAGGEYEQAAGYYAAALERDPRHAQTHLNFAAALRHLGLNVLAAGCYQEVLRLDPGHAAARAAYAALLAELASSYYDAARFADAAVCCREGLRWAANDPLLHILLGRALLVQEDLANAWGELEWRWRQSGAPAIDFRQPLWDGSPLDGRTILLWAEQGAGDTIQFLRYARLLRSPGARVVLECQPWLARLARTNPDLDQVAPHGEPLPDFDVHAPLQSLPWILGTRRETIPAQIPYLRADEALVEQWRARLSGYAARKVGLVWAGSPLHPNDARRSLAFERLAPLGQCREAAFFSLQKGAAAFELHSTPEFAVVDLAPQLTDFAETAAAVMCLDLVISVDTAVAHLAGALGRPVWMLTAFAGDPRWFASRADTPWYPAMRLFRQPAPGDWTGAIEAVREALR